MAKVFLEYEAWIYFPPSFQIQKMYRCRPAPWPVSVAAGRAHRRALFAEKLPPDSELSDLISTQRPP